MLLLDPLRDACRQLEKSLDYYNSTMAKADEDLREQFRAACIQAFEFTYELSVKALRRTLEQTADSADTIDALGYRDMIRMAAEKRLISDPQAWFEYRALRNTTSHTYDHHKAQAVMVRIPDFATVASQLLAALEKRQQPHAS